MHFESSYVRTLICVEVAQVLQQLFLVAGQNVNYRVTLVGVCYKDLCMTGMPIVHNKSRESCAHGAICSMVRAMLVTSVI